MIKDTSTTWSPRRLPCPVCKAPRRHVADPTCWLCGAKLGELATDFSPAATAQDKQDDRRWLGIGMVVVCILTGLLPLAGVEILLVLVVVITPALVRGIVHTTLAFREGRGAGLVDMVSVLISSTGIVAAILLVSVVAFYVTLYPISLTIWLVFQRPPRTEIVILLSCAVSLCAGIWLTRLLWPPKR